MSQQDLSMVEAFRAAKKYLSPTARCTNNRPKFICFALRHAQRAGTITEMQADAARKVIAVRLAGHFSFEEWLAATHPELSMAVITDAYNSNSRKLQKTRQAWLDSLIKEFS